MVGGTVSGNFGGVDDPGMDLVASDAMAPMTTVSNPDGAKLYMYTVQDGGSIENVYEFLLETTSLFIRLVALVDYDEDMVNDVFSESLDYPGTTTGTGARGSECVEWMVAGEDPRIAGACV